MDATQTTPLRKARMCMGWSPEEVARQLRTTKESVERWETGAPIPNVYLLRKVCRLYNKSSEELGLRVGPVAVYQSLPLSHRGSEPQDQTVEESTPLFDPVIPPVPALVGRAREQRALRAFLCKEKRPIAALYGLPGVGKTSIAIALANDSEVRVHFCDGILWASLGPNPNLLGLLSRWGGLLGISATDLSSPDKVDAWAHSIRHMIGERKMLLVIDDTWSVEEALTFKVGGPNCAYLLTTRYPEIATFIALDGAIKIQALNEEEGLNLLHQLVPDVVLLETKRAQDLVHAVGGLPLALSLMGNYLREQTENSQQNVTSVLEHLSHAEERLQLQASVGRHVAQDEPHGDIPRSLQFVISITDQHMNEATRSALYSLSAFPPRPNTFSEEAALEVAACGVEALDTLMDMGILESSGGNRYTLHQTIRDYAYLQLQRSAEYESAQRRFVLYMCSFVDANVSNFEALDLESSSILSALGKAYYLAMHSELLRMVLKSTPYAQVRGFYAQAEMHLQRAEQIARLLGERKMLATIHYLLGQVSGHQGKLAAAEQAFRRGLALARELEDTRLMSASLNELGWLLCKLGNYSMAENYLQEGLHFARLIGNKQRMSQLLRVLGSLNMLKGEYARSNAYLQESYELARQGQDRDLMNILLVNLGVNTGQQGDFLQARKYFLEGLQFAREMQHRERVSAILSNLGAVEMDLHNYVQAEAYLQEGLQLARQIGHREWAGVHLLNLGETALTAGRLDEAEQHLSASLALAEELGHVIIASKALYARAQIQLKRSCVEEAERMFIEMQKIIPEGDKILHALAQFGQAMVTAARGDLPLALELGKRSLECLKSLGDGSAREVEQWLEERRSAR